MRILLWLLPLCVFFPSVGRSQIFQPVYMPSTLSSQMTHLIMQQAMRRNASSPENPASNSGTKRSSPEATAVSMVYASVKSRTRVNLAKFVEKSRAVDPTGAAKMAEIFASTDVIGLIDQRIQQTYGMRANNVADAYAVWWASAWLGAQGRNDNPTKGQMAMIKRQVVDALAVTPGFASATDAGKQELAEALLVQAALIGDTVDTYKSDPAMLAKTRASINKGVKAMGIDLGTMTLTDEGFKPARKTGTLETSDETQLAARDSAAPQPARATDKQPPYLLLAAAGGVGLGGAFLIGKALGRRG